MRVRPERVDRWEQTGKLSAAQVSNLAQATRTPRGFLYLSEPPKEHLPITDFRFMGSEEPLRPSPDLLETVFQMQRRCGWMHEELSAGGSTQLDFVGACTMDDSLKNLVATMQTAVNLKDGWTSSVDSWTDAWRFLRNLLEEAGVLVISNSLVGNNTHRRLDRTEFQGFAIADPFAPLIFINSSDFRAAQIFTLVHEMAHLVLAESGLTRFRQMHASPHVVERRCDAAAAEFLVPTQLLKDFWNTIPQGANPCQAVAEQFRVSTLVAGRRALDLNLIKRDIFDRIFQDSMAEATKRRTTRDGNFWSLQDSRIGAHFAAAVMRAVKEGRLSYVEAYGLTGLSGRSFPKIIEEMQIRL